MSYKDYGKHTITKNFNDKELAEIFKEINAEGNDGPRRTYFYNNFGFGYIEKFLDDNRIDRLDPYYEDIYSKVVDVMQKCIKKFDSTRASFETFFKDACNYSHVFDLAFTPESIKRLGLKESQLKLYRKIRNIHKAYLIDLEERVDDEEQDNEKYNDNEIEEQDDNKNNIYSKKLNFPEGIDAFYDYCESFYSDEISSSQIDFYIDIINKTKGIGKFNSQLDKDEKSNGSEYVEDDKSESEVKNYEKEDSECDLGDIILKYSHLLTKDELYVLKHCFGIKCKKISLKEISIKMKINHNTVTQIKKMGLSKIKLFHKQAKVAK